MSTSIQDLADQVAVQTERIILGKPEAIRLVIMAILAEGHILLDDLPGVGKTTLVKTISKALGCSANRIQFVPDLQPGDILGMRIFNQKTGEFELQQGPVMTNLLLADEINRAIPRTQSALLEAMEERQISIDRETYPLPKPFIVLATQNPVEMESTFRLPAAQMDRFLVRISLGYPSPEKELEILQKLGDFIPLEEVTPVTNASEVVAMQQSAHAVHVSEEIMAYIVALTAATRSHSELKLGASPRASRALFKAAKVWAAMEGRDFVIPDDVQTLLHPVLEHRLMLSAEARFSGRTATTILDEILAATPVPPTKEELLREH